MPRRAFDQLGDGCSWDFCPCSSGHIEWFAPRGAGWGAPLMQSRRSERGMGEAVGVGAPAGETTGGQR